MSVYFVRSSVHASIFLFAVGSSALAAQENAPALPMIDPERGVLSFAPLLAESLPAVVRVVSLGGARSSSGPREVEGNGSGAIINAEAGLVLTNEHVVRGAQALQVELADGRQLDAELLGADDATDIALLRIPAGDLVEIATGDSDNLRVGDLVFAIGYPFGLEQTVTMGVVSGLGRTTDGDGIEDFIQTDAPINSGNSGGPLIDSLGRLVGINTAIFSPQGPQGGNVGIGFVIPSRIALAIADQIERVGEVRRGRIGVSIQEMTPELAEGFDLERAVGVIVGAVEPGSTAEAAGLVTGDVILQADGRDVENMASLQSVIGVLEAGNEVLLEVLREGERLEVGVAISAPAAAMVAVASDGEAVSVFGATFRDSEPGDQTPQRLFGAMVTEVLEGTVAARHGLVPGDLVTAVDEEQVASAAELAKAVGSTPGPWRLAVVRQGANALIPVIISE
jgi:Do/DeqQ family serine protease